MKRALGLCAVVVMGAAFTLVGFGVGAQAGNGSQKVFEFTGGAQDFEVPADVCQVTVDAYGAEGGQGANPDGDPVPGGLGGKATSTISVTPGETLQVNVGGQGVTTTGGFNGGGDGGSAEEDHGGGGGGASDVRRAAGGLDDRVVVAGAGGGGGADEDTVGKSTGGGGGGTVGEDGAPSGSSPVTPAGGGGTQTAGGTAPTLFDPTATVGSSGQGGLGGVGVSDDDAGGGGGGGFFGGGGGAGEDDGAKSDGGGGGGGGSGFTPDGSGMTTGVRAGNGTVTISYTVDPGCADLPGPAPKAGVVAARPAFTG